MTPSLPRPPSALTARAVAAGLLLAGCATTAASQVRAPAGSASAPRVAVLAGPDAAPAAVARAAAGRSAEVRHAGGLLEAQAQAAALAAEGYDVVIGVGPQARAAVGQARGAELGTATRWSTSG